MKANLKFKRLMIRQYRNKVYRLKALRNKWRYAGVNCPCIDPKEAIVYFLTGAEKHLFVQATRTDKVILTGRVMAISALKLYSAL